MICYAKLRQWCPTLCYPIECSPPGSSVHGFSGQEYWSELPCPPPGDLPNPEVEPLSLMSPMLTGRFLPIWEALIIIYHFFNNTPPLEKSPHVNSKSVELERDKLCNACQTNTKHVRLYVCVYVCMCVCVCTLTLIFLPHSFSLPYNF